MQPLKPDNVEPPAAPGKRAGPPQRRGPNTEAGKKAVRWNAWKHGITAKDLVLEDLEDALDWKAHRDGILESLAPEGHLECTLAERIAICLWKLRRLERYQTAATDTEYWRSFSRLQSFKHEDLTETEKLERRLANIFPRGKEADLILRYDAHYHRQYIQTLHELEAMQERRKGRATPLARVDIFGSPSG